MRVVLDTNVIISGLNFPGNERMVLDLARRSRFELYLYLFIIGEVAEVLEREFNWPDDRSSMALETLQQTATVIEPRRHPAVIKPDHADNRILACAVQASADYLITGERRHLLPLKEHRGTRIVNAPQFLTALAGHA